MDKDIKKIEVDGDIISIGDSTYQLSNISSIKFEEKRINNNSLLKPVKNIQETLKSKLYSYLDVMLFLIIVIVGFWVLHNVFDKNGVGLGIIIFVIFIFKKWKDFFSEGSIYCIFDWRIKCYVITITVNSGVSTDIIGFDHEFMMKIYNFIKQILSLREKSVSENIIFNIDKKQIIGNIDKVINNDFKNNKGQINIANDNANIRAKQQSKI